jgi:hypothetical protein
MSQIFVYESQITSGAIIDWNNELRVFLLTFDQSLIFVSILYICF